MTAAGCALVAVAALVLAATVALCVARVRRLDRLHVRLDAARDGLASALERRSRAALAAAAALDTAALDTAALDTAALDTAALDTAALQEGVPEETAGLGMAPPAPSGPAEPSSAAPRPTGPAPAPSSLGPPAVPVHARSTSPVPARSTGPVPARSTGPVPARPAAPAPARPTAPVPARSVAADAARAPEHPIAEPGPGPTPTPHPTPTSDPIPIGDPTPTGGPTPTALRRAATAALRAAPLAPPDRELAENALGRRLAALDRDLLPPAVRAELADAEQLVVLARHVHNDAVRDTLGLRSRRLVRWLRLAGTAPHPVYFEIADPGVSPGSGRAGDGSG